MGQKLHEKRRLLDVVLSAPIVILTLTQFLPSNVILSLSSMLLICTFPGFALLHRFKLHRSSRFQDLFFSVLFSLLLLEVVYAAYSVFCFGLGFEHSLTRAQVFIIAIVILIFSSLSLRNNIDILVGYQFISNIFLKLRSKNSSLYLIPMGIPLLALVAVSRLNTLNDSMLTFIFLYFCIGILLLLQLGRISRKSYGLKFVTFYCTLLALLFGTSFRGDGGFWGWDINQEFAIADRVLLQQHWIPISQSPYNAMLSISVLPVVISLVTKFSLTIVFKLLFPFIAALIPISSYSLLMLFVRNSIAMNVVTIQTIGSISYIYQITTLSRQIVGIAFFVGILLVLLDPIWDREKKTKVILIFTFGLSFSHYSSAYLCTAIFLAAGLLSVLVRRIPFFRLKGLKPVATLGLGLSMLLITFLWNGLLNNSVKDVNLVVENIVSKGPQFLPNKSGSFIDRWLSGASGAGTYTEASPADFKVAVLKNNAFAFPNFQIDPVSISYDVTPAYYPQDNTTLGLFIPDFFYWSRIVINFIFQLLIVIQIFLIAKLILGFSTKGNKIDIDREGIKIPTILLDIFPILCVSFLLAVFLRTSGTNGVLYGPERAAFQLAFVFSLPIALLMESYLRRRKRFYRFGLTALLFSSFIFLQEATGLIGYIYGSQDARISSSMSPYSSFVISENERKAADWIYTSIPKNSYLQSDNLANMANSQKNTFFRRPFISQTAPFGLFTSSYIYLSNSNLESGITSQTIGGYGTFRVPFEYLEQNLSVVYSSGGARVYR